MTHTARLHPPPQPAMVPCEACAHYHQTDQQVIVCQRREIRKLREELRLEIGGGVPRMSPRKEQP